MTESQPPNVRVLALRFRDRRVILDKPRLLIGRATDCDVILDGPLISRQHAELVVDGNAITVADLGSRNGVFVNGTRIEAPTELRGGDQLSIGGETAVVVRPDDGADATVLRRAMTLTGMEPIAAPTPAAGTRAFDDGNADEATRAASTLELLAPVFDKVLRMGRVDEAERLVGRQLEAIARRASRREPLSRPLVELTTSLALRLADGSAQAQWIDFAVTLNADAELVMSVEAVDQLYQLVRRVRGTDVRRLERYVTALRALQARLSPSERFVLNRLEGLLQVAVA